MACPIQLIVGLANPGKEYEKTRHNAGAWFVETLAKEAGIVLKKEVKFHGLCAQAHLDNHTCLLLIPTTFMNLSGRAIRAAMQYLKIAPDAILVAHDEIDLPIGTVKLKFDGGDGGHNGLKDTISQLHTKQFYRLRIGVGHPGNSKDVVDYVLQPPSKSQRQLIDLSIERAKTILPLLLAGDIGRAMQTLHTETKE